MSNERIREGLRTWNDSKRAATAQRTATNSVTAAAPVPAASPKPPTLTYCRAFIEAPIGQPGLGVAISEADFKRAGVVRSEDDPAGFVRHYAYRAGQHVEIIEIPAAEVRSIMAEEGA